MATTGIYRKDDKRLKNVEKERSKDQKSQEPGDPRHMGVL